MIIQAQTTIYVQQQKAISEAIQNLIDQLKLSEHNKLVYAELVKDLRQHENGLLSFTLRVSAGEIVDYVVMDNVLPDTPLND